MDTQENKESADALRWMGSVLLMERLRRNIRGRQVARAWNLWRSHLAAKSRERIITK